MAELYPTGVIPNSDVTLQDAAISSPQAVPQTGGAGPLWRSLLFPHQGQRAVELSGDDSELFVSLREAGVQLGRRTDESMPPGEAVFDLVLEHRANGQAPARPDRIRSLLRPGGRWVVVLEDNRWVGLAARRILRRARQEGFESIETFYAYPSLRSPRILVPLDHPEPFHYFLRLAVGVRAPRQRLLALGARCLCYLGLHRILLSNLIVVARTAR
jgi:hypothetical protein